MSESAPARVHVVGLGSLFRADDAFGPAVIEELRAGWDFSEDVLLTDAGTPGIDLLSLLSGRTHVILVDAVRSGAEAGQVRRFSGDEALRHASSARLSIHSLDLRETLRLLDATGQAPRNLMLVGVEPLRVEGGIGLTPPVRQAVPEAARAVVDLLTEIGVPPTPKSALR